MKVPTGLLLLRERAAPATPVAGHVVLYSVDGSALLMKDEAGVVTNMGPESVHNSAVATQTPAAATDVYITGSDVTIPAGRLQARSKYILDMSITKGAAGTGTPTFNVRVGTAGTTADASRCLFTWPAANTAVADEMRCTILVTVRSVGAGTAAVLEGMLIANHELTTTGFGGTGLGANIIVNTTGGGFDSTVAGLKIGVSVNGGTASAWSIRQAQAELTNLAA